MYLTIEEYLTIAEKVITKARLSLSEDNIAYVAGNLMLADWRYKPDCGLTREDFRGMYAHYSKKDLRKKNRKKSVDYSLDWVYSTSKNNLSRLVDSLEDKKTRTPDKITSEKETLDKIRELKNLTENEKNILLEFLTNNKSVKSMGNEVGIKGKYVYQCLKNALEKVKPLVEQGEL